MTAKQAFRFTRIVCCKMLHAFFVVFPGKFEQVQGADLASDSERQRHLDEQIDPGIEHDGTLSHFVLYKPTF